MTSIHLQPIAGAMLTRFRNIKSAAADEIWRGRIQRRSRHRVALVEVVGIA